MARFRLARGRVRRSRSRRAGKSAIGRATKGRQAHRTAGAHHQGQGRVLHGEQREVALLSAQGPGVRASDEGARRVKEAFINKMISLAERDPKLMFLTGDL